jgi:P27 family predicted phage terminase small subunit
MPGPAPKPARQKQMEGTYRKDREAPNALAFDPANDLPAPPDDLRPEAARQCWKVCAKELHVKGMLATVDLALLRAYCYQTALMMEAEEELELNGKTEVRHTANGSHMVRSPWVAILSDATEKVAKIGQQFGFSPSSRTRISVPEKKDDKKSGFAAFKK